MKEIVLEILLYILFARISLAEIKLVIPVSQCRALHLGAETFTLSHRSELD